MAIRSYEISITGVNALLMHWDNIKGAELVKRWSKDPDNQGMSVAGDDRSPGWTWINYLYYDDSLTNEADAVVAMPSDNIMRSFMEAGALIPSGKGKSTLKATVMSGMSCKDTYMPLLVQGRTVPMAPFLALRRQNVTDFDQHIQAANAAGFHLFVKRAKVGTSKHVRVRPRFNRWQMTVTVDVWDDLISDQNLQQIASRAGRYKGLGDWRPSSPKSPGPWGTFEAVVKRIN